jgi:hypothetical protein
LAEFALRVATPAPELPVGSDSVSMAVCSTYVSHAFLIQCLDRQRVAHLPPFSFAAMTEFT